MRSILQKSQFAKKVQMIFVFLLHLKAIRYKIMAWDVMSYDFDPNMNETECFKIVANHAKDGSVIVFHDNLKAKQILLKVLPTIIEHYLKKSCLCTAL